MSIRMNTEDVIARGQEIESHVEDVTALQNYLNNVVNSQLPELWEGSGYEGFAARVAEMAPSFEAMRELISSIGQGVVMNAQQYAEFDRTAGSLNRR
ncbi:MAG: WXG100 family type VII secretion target [Dorea sp.]|jgi:WXG100 family type VII secretion target|nr:WXG100 family type VII secretion target [Dorea sp.]